MSKPDETAFSDSKLPIVPRTIEPGDTIGRFVIDGRLGGGAMGIVYAAHDPELDRKVAIKVIKSSSRHPDLKDRLRREAQSLARIAHPNVVVVHEVGDFDGELFLAMELVVGVTLTIWLQGERTHAEILEVFRQAGHGLAAAHAAGIVHRDFKPDNVLVGDDGRVRVTDFGVARVDGSAMDVGVALNAIALVEGKAISRPPLDPASSPLAVDLTATGMMIGTPLYASPEQMQALPPTVASDQFSFCVVLYDALYKQHPFGGGANMVALVERVINGQPIDPPAGATVEPRIAAALRRGLLVAPSDRFPSMNALISAIEPVAAPKRRRWILVAAPLVIVAAVVAFFALRGDAAPAACALDRRAVDDTWNAAAKKRVVDHLALDVERPHVAASLVARLDGYAATLVDAVGRTCGAALTGDGKTAPRIACLKRRVAELVASREAAATKATDVAWLLTKSMTPIASCDLAVDNVEPILGLQTKILATRPAFEARNFDDVTTALEAALRAHPQRQLASIRIDVLSMLAQAATNDEKFADAERWFDTAMMEAGDDRLLRAETASRVADYHAGRGNIDRAKAALTATDGVDDIIVARTVAATRGTLAMAAKNRDEAIAQWEIAFALATELGELSPVVSVLEKAYREAGRDADADKLVERGLLVIGSEATGLMRASNDCIAAFVAGDLPRTRTVCKDAAERSEKVQMLERFAIRDYTTIGQTHELDRVDLAAARANYVKAVELARLHEPAELPSVLESAARVALELGDAKSAVDEYRASAEAAATLGPAGAEQVAYARYGLGRALVAAGDLPAALVELEWAMPRLEALPEVAHITLASARIAYATALWARNANNDRARAKLSALTAQDDVIAHHKSLAADATNVYAKFYVATADRVGKRIADWLAAHR